jgi:hypothetical protein
VKPTKPKPPTGQLTPTQAYYVSLSMTNTSGGLDAIPSLERLSALPNRRDPLLVELGVLEGGKRVLFALQPGALVAGRGTCIPGPVDCRILSLRAGEVEKLSSRTQAGAQQIGLFAITAIAPRHYKSTAAAEAARRVKSSYGNELLREAGSGVMSLFRFDPNVGAIVDGRNLAVGS